MAHSPALHTEVREEHLTLDKTAWWFFFFFIVYVIVLFKFVTSAFVLDDVFFGIYSLAITIYIFSRFLLSYLHAPVRTSSDYEPTVTFVVPAKNEEGNIFETITRFAKVDYPLHKVEIIAINDGSTDRTLDGMHCAARATRSLVKRMEVVDFGQNLGKRHAMAEGAKRARGEIIIFIDSDSFVSQDCVRAIVKYFNDPKIGGVSGHTDVANAHVNMLTRMQSLRYYVAFKVYKSAESVFGAVTCLPGCCSAYRRAYLMEFIDEWLHQKFLGKECTFGDDRSLTNYMIRKYRAVYAFEARAATMVPENFSTYRRQQQRWKKSWVRETLIAATFFWRTNPLASIFFYTYLFLAFAAPIVFLHAIFWDPIVYDIPPYAYFFGLMLIMLLHGVYYRIHTGSRGWLLPVLSFWFYSLILMWQLPWAVVTVADTKWGTR